MIDCDQSQETKTKRRKTMHARNQQSLIKVMDADTGHKQTHVVKRDQTSKWVKSFRAQGFKVLYVQHDYQGEAQ
jgi:hypothetical protein